MISRALRRLALLAMPVVAIAVAPDVARPDLYVGAHASLGTRSGFFYVNADSPAYLDIAIHMEYVSPQLTIVDDSPGTYGNYWQGSYDFNCAETGRYNSSISGNISVTASSEAGYAYGYSESTGGCGGRDDYWNG